MKNDNPTSDRASCLRMSNQMDNCYNHRLDYYPYHLRVWDQTDDAILSWITHPYCAECQTQIVNVAEFLR